MHILTKVPWSTRPSGLETAAEGEITRSLQNAATLISESQSESTSCIELKPAECISLSRTPVALAPLKHVWSPALYHIQGESPSSARKWPTKNLSHTVPCTSAQQARSIGSPDVAFIASGFGKSPLQCQCGIPFFNDHLTSVPMW